METNELAAIGYATAMTVLGLLTVLLFGRRKYGAKSFLIAGASGASVVWGGVPALQNVG